VAIALGASAVGAKPAGKPDSGTAYVAVTHSVGPINVAAGDATDKVTGAGAVVYRIHVLTTTKPGTLAIKANKVTAYSATGSLTGTAVSKLTILDSKGNATVSNGVLTLTNGTGGEKGHSLTAKFTGKGNINTGQYRFNYVGTYR